MNELYILKSTNFSIFNTQHHLHTINYQYTLHIINILLIINQPIMCNLIIYIVNKHTYLMINFNLVLKGNSLHILTISINNCNNTNQ